MFPTIVQAASVFVAIAPLERAKCLAFSVLAVRRFPPMPSLFQSSRSPEARGRWLLDRNINDGANTGGFWAILPAASCWLAASSWLGEDVWGNPFCPTLRTNRPQTDSRLRKNCPSIAINMSSRATVSVADGFVSVSGRKGIFVSKECNAELC